MIIFTGGEPLLRPDFFDIVAYARSLDLICVVGTNGTLVTPEIATRMQTAGISRVSVSLDFPMADLHDKFRGHQGAFESAMTGIRNLKAAGVPFQINTTVTKLNVDHLEATLNMAIDLGAAAFHPFMLVPTGRAKDMSDVELSAEDYEATLNWIYDRQIELGDRIFFKPTDAPHYLRVIRQRRSCGSTGCGPAEMEAKHTIGTNPHNQITRGCLAGTGFCFISHLGRVQGCGYLDLEAGNVREQTFSEVWYDSPLFNDIRDLSKLKGKCGICEYQRLCGGCRARAYESTGDYLESEPYCLYQPAPVPETAR
jgi:radical SAM protein with 4Fe4S-binding SPASM domain